MVDLRYLRSFAVVAEEQHITRAAKRLNIAQPGLTQQMKALEDSLGASLFRKSGRGIELTPAGRYLQKEAQELLRRTEAVCGAVRDFGRSGTRTLRVAMSDVGTLGGPITTLLRQFRESRPDIVLTQQSLQSEDIAAALRDGRADLAFSCSSVPNRHDLARHLLGAIDPLVACPVAHPFASRESVSFAEVFAEPFILVSNGERPGSFEASLRQLCTDRQVVPHFLEITPSFLVALSMVASGAGIALVPAHVRGLRGDSIHYATITDAPRPMIEYALYLRRNEPDSDLLALAAMCSESTGPLPLSERRKAHL